MEFYLTPERSTVLQASYGYKVATFVIAFKGGYHEEYSLLAIFKILDNYFWAAIFTMTLLFSSVFIILNNQYPSSRRIISVTVAIFKLLANQSHELDSTQVFK